MVDRLKIQTQTTMNNAKLIRTDSLLRLADITSTNLAQRSLLQSLMPAILMIDESGLTHEHPRLDSFKDYRMSVTEHALLQWKPSQRIRPILIPSEASSRP